MDISTQLKGFGLHKSEIAVYLYLLEFGLSTPPQIAKGTKIARTNCYNVLLELKNKGLIQEQEKGKRHAYIANDPESLLHSLELKKNALEKVIPDIRLLYSSGKNKPKIKFYEGIEQIKEVFLQTLSAREVYGIGSTKAMSDLMPEFFIFYNLKLKEKGIMFHDILTSNSKLKGAPEQMATLKGLDEIKFLPNKFKEQPTDILIWDESIALINLGNPIFGTVITSPMLAQTFKVIFQVMWEGL